MCAADEFAKTIVGEIQLGRPSSSGRVEHLIRTRYARRLVRVIAPVSPSRRSAPRTRLHDRGRRRRSDWGRWWELIQGAGSSRANGDSVGVLNVAVPLPHAVISPWRSCRSGSRGAVAAQGSVVYGEFGQSGIGDRRRPGDSDRCPGRACPVANDRRPGPRVWNVMTTFPKPSAVVAIS